MLSVRKVVPFRAFIFRFPRAYITSKHINWTFLIRFLNIFLMKWLLQLLYYLLINSYIFCKCIKFFLVNLISINAREESSYFLLGLLNRAFGLGQPTGEETTYFPHLNRNKLLCKHFSSRNVAKTFRE